MKPPAFQLYADDLIAGTIKFTDAELGLYMRLLCAQWSECSLPDDDEELLSYGRGKTPLARVKAKFHKGPDGRLRNQRMETVRQEQEEYRENRRESGKRGAEKRWHSHGTANSKAIAQPMANTMAKHGSPSPTPTPTPLLSARALGDADLPTWPEVKTEAEMRAIPEASAKTFFDHHEGNQLWLNQFGKLINWKHKLISWAANDRQPKGNKNATRHPTAPDRNAGTYNAEPLSDAAKSKVR